MVIRAYVRVCTYKNVHACVGDEERDEGGTVGEEWEKEATESRGLPRRGSSFLAESFPRSRRFSSLRDLPILYISPSCTLVRKRHGPPRRNSVSSLALGGVGISKNFQHRYTPIFDFPAIYTRYIFPIYTIYPLSFAGGSFAYSYLSISHPWRSL